MAHIIILYSRMNSIFIQTIKTEKLIFIKIKMEEYCKTLDIIYIDRERQVIKDEIKRVLDKEVSLSKIPSDKKHLYYILHSYFYPVKIESHGSKLTIANLCDYFAVYKLTDLQIKNLFFTVYNKINLKGLKPDLSNNSIKYLEELFKIVDEVYFDNLINKWLKAKSSTVNFILKDEYSNIAGTCSKTGCAYVINIATNLFSKYFETMKVQKVNGIQCRNSLACMIIVFLHELTHLIIYVFCPNYCPPDHPKKFKDITKSLFGHTEFTHSFGRDSSLVGLTKDELQKRKYISFTEKDNSIVIAKINKIKIKRVSITVIKGNDKLKKGEMYSIPFSIINKEEPEVSEKDESKVLPLATDSSLIGLTKDELQKRKYISVTGKDNSIVIAKINKININSVNITVIKGYDKIKKGEMYSIPFSIINKEEPEVSEKDESKVPIKVNIPVVEKLVIKVGRIVKLEGEYLPFEIAKITDIEGNNITVKLYVEGNKGKWEYDGSEETFIISQIIGVPTKEDIAKYKKGVRALERMW